MDVAISSGSRHMSGFQRLKVDGFRRLCGVDIDFTDRPLCALIGANGSGKSSVLDVMSFLAASAQGKMAEKLNDFAGLAGALTKGKAERLALGVVAVDTDRHGSLRYDLTLAPRGYSYTVESESLARV